MLGWTSSTRRRGQDELGSKQLGVTSLPIWCYYC
jgi:hypothetical protein